MSYTYKYYNNCKFCTEHEPGDTLYESYDWDNGFGFDYIRDIQYCPICGSKLIEWDKRKEEDEYTD